MFDFRVSIALLSLFLFMRLFSQLKKMIQAKRDSIRLK